MFNEWNKQVLKDTNLEMMKTAALISNEPQTLKYLAELIDSHSESFLAYHKTQKLWPEDISKYAKLIFTDITNKLPDFMKDEWKQLSFMKKIIMYFLFKLAERKMRELATMATLAKEFY